MLTIDDDMVVPFGDPKWFQFYTGFLFPEKFLAFNAIDRLMSHGKTLVGALYFGRARNAPAVYAEGQSEASYARRGPHDVCKPTKWVGTGCMLVHRSVFEDIEKAFPRLSRANNSGHGQWFTSTEASVMQNLHTTLDFARGSGTKEQIAETLDKVIALANSHNSLGSGEDVSFCMRAIGAGHQPHIDMGLICGHLGQYCYGPTSTL
jgi:hypothetical protein